MRLGDVIGRTGRAEFHALLDSGAGYRLERFGARTLVRPDPNALWEPRLAKAEWQRRADAWFHKEKRFGSSHWERLRPGGEPWIVSQGELRFALRLTPFKHTGIFPEQSANWSWIQQLVRQRAAEGGERPRVLNLFAYTGAASLAAAAAGAEVCHLDASKDVVDWAAENQRLSGLQNAPLRWIVDDAGKFLAREIRRGRRYDGILLDPPAFGRDPKGQVFRFESHVGPLLKDCAALLSDRPLFCLVNAYSLGYSATVLGALLAEHLPAAGVELGELRLEEEPLPGLLSRPLSCSVYARWSSAAAPAGSRGASDADERARRNSAPVAAGRTAPDGGARRTPGAGRTPAGGGRAGGRDGATEAGGGRPNAERSGGEGGGGVGASGGPAAACWPTPGEWKGDGREPETDRPRSSGGASGNGPRRGGGRP